MRTSTDVLVVGAGPVGLLLACELQRQGVDYLLAERSPQRSYFCKALGVTPRTLELFEALDIAEEAIDCGVWLTGWTIFENGVESGSRDLSWEGLPFGFLALPQYDTERILEACLKRHGGVVSRGVALTDFAEEGDRIKARVRDATGATHSIECDWLVGCDGARSTVRKGLKLKFEGDKYPIGFALGDVELDWDRPRGPAYRFTQTVEGQMRNGMVAVPVRGSARRYRLSMGYPEPRAEESLEDIGAEVNTPPSLEELAAIAGPMLPPDTHLSNLRWSSFYRISHRIVPIYSIGKVFLAGDAAHIHPPIGGLGMNTGLQDAHNLSWKLALVAHRAVGPGLLESYSAERHPVGLDVVEETSRAMDEAVSTGWRRPSAAGRESQLLIHYRSSGWVQDDVPTDQDNSEAPRAGDRAPDAFGLGRPFVAHRSRLRERLERGNHVLIGYFSGKNTESDQRVFADLLSMIRRGLDRSAAGMAILDPKSHFVDGELIPAILDCDGSFHQIYLARSGMVWLIRPDGHIAWRCDRADPDRLALFLDRFGERLPSGEAMRRG
jgi:2-polyprenyl-6-methoxyphenol hydroxylase-like FAD-dependent oxidoreductase